ncbi:MAG: A24 family peptidase [Cyanobacteriota bacterium]|nr:A24 family peptidase [Cyanobacteriota bacterium]
MLIDLDHLWLPEPLCRWGVVLGLLVSTAADIPVLASHLIAAVLALLLLESLSALAERLMGQPALGLGDAKLAALGGAWLGHGGIAAAMALAVVSGALVGRTARLSGRLGPREPFPFGPFIALCIWLVWLTGPQCWWNTWVMLLGA